MNHIYFGQPYQTTVDTFVESAIRDSGKLMLCMDQNLFHARGGGQPDDHGAVELRGLVVPVDTLIKRKGSTFAVVCDRQDFEEVGFGESVRCKLDWSRRYRLMRYHTAAHVMMRALAQIVSGYVPCGINIEDDGSACSVNFEAAPEGLADVEVGSIVRLAAGVVAADLPVFAETYKSVDAARAAFGQTFRADPSLTFRGSLRVVTIAGFDSNPCGGSHVARTSEVGRLCVGPFSPHESQSGASLSFTLEDSDAMPNPPL